MLTQNDIAINGALFWIVAFAAIAALNLATTARAKALVFAGVNVAFLWLLLKASLAPVLLFLAGFHVSLLFVRRRRAATTALAIVALVLLALFIVNKLHARVAEFAPAGVILSVVGFSFVVLRCIEVLRVVYSGDAPPPPVMLLNYLVPFHMLAAGPIAAYEDYKRAPFDEGPRSTGEVVDGFELIARGLFNKFVLCYIIDKLFLNDFDSQGPLFVVEVLMFTLWSYLDFSAYSNIALGIGRLAGVPTPVNFRDPLLARNIIDFWDRWHISLSRFVKRNVFMPIQIALMRSGGRPRPLLYASFATAVSFLLVGLWHGLSIGWLIWGSLQAAGLIGVRVYTHVLQRRLSPGQFAAYRSNVPIRIAATMTTYTYVAFAFVPVAMYARVTQ